eukprot:scaffold118417_cov67-Phaeocystis_antarctica.AAC.2
MTCVQWRGMANTCRAVAAAIVDRRSRDGQGFEPLSPPARYIYGSRHTRMCVSFLAEAVAPRDSCRPHAAQARLESSCQQGESKFWLAQIQGLQSQAESWESTGCFAHQSSCFVCRMSMDRRPLMGRDRCGNRPRAPGKVTGGCFKSENGRCKK